MEKHQNPATHLPRAVVAASNPGRDIRSWENRRHWDVLQVNSIEIHGRIPWHRQERGKSWQRTKVITYPACSHVSALKGICPFLVHLSLHLTWTQVEHVWESVTSELSAQAAQPSPHHVTKLKGSISRLEFCEG